MSKISNGSFYLVQGWMLNKLHLSGTKLLTYAIIYGFSQDGETEFSGSLQYLSDFTGASKRTIIRTLIELCENNYIIKTSQNNNGVITNKYKANLNYFKDETKDKEEKVSKQEDVSNVTPSDKMTQGGCQNDMGGSDKMAPNNIDNNKINNNIFKREKKERKSPSLKEIEEFAQLKNRTDLAEKFFNYYEEGNWRDKDNKEVKNWKLKFITWLNKEKQQNKKPEIQKTEQEIRKKKIDDVFAWGQAEIDKIIAENSL